MQLPDRKQATSWQGRPVVDRDGAQLGRCDGVYADTDTGAPEWLDVGVPDLGRTFVPALGAHEADGSVQVEFSRELVVSAPRVGDAVQLSKADERTLYTHYGVRSSTDRSGSLLPEEAEVTSSDPDTEPLRTGQAETTTTNVPTGAAGTAATGTLTSRDDEEDEVPPPDAAVQDPGPLASDATPVAAPEPSAPAPATVPAAEPEPEPVTAPTAPPRLSSVPSPPPPPSPNATGKPAPEPMGGPETEEVTFAAVAPLAAVAALAVAVGLALRARDRRAARRTPVARASSWLDVIKEVDTRQVSAGLATASDVAGKRARAAAGTLSAASETAAERAAATARTQKKAAAALGAQVASSAASAGKEAGKRREAAAKSAAKTTAAHRKAAEKAARQHRKAAAKRKKAATAQTAALVQAVSSRSESAADSTRTAARRQQRAVSRSVSSATPRLRRRRPGPLARAGGSVVRGVRGVKRAIGRGLFDVVLAATVGGGYVLGAKAGEERYEEIRVQAKALADRAR